MQQCKDVDTPVTKAGEESINTGDELNENEARRARRAIARMNDMSQDRPHLSVAARLMSQYMSRPRADSSSDQAGHQILETLSSMLPCGAEQSLRKLRDWRVE